MLQETLKLEVGGYYRNGNGQIVGPLISCEDVSKKKHNSHPFTTAGPAFIYTPEGKLYASGHFSKHDLIEQVEAPKL